MQVLLWLGAIAGYIFIGGLFNGIWAESPVDRRPNDIKLAVTLFWPIVFWLVVLVDVWRRGLALGKRLNRELRIEVKAAAMRELTRVIDELERDTEIARESFPPTHTRSLSDRRKEADRSSAGCPRCYHAPHEHLAECRFCFCASERPATRTRSHLYRNPEDRPQ